MARDEYAEFELTFSRGAPGGPEYYRVQIESPAGRTTGAFTEPATSVARDAITNAIKGLGKRRVDSQHGQLVKDLGKQLFASIFQKTVLEAYTNSLLVAKREGKNLRIRLRFQDVPELLNVPWEYLYDESKDVFFARNRRTPLVRSLDILDEDPALEIEPPLNILVVLSSPSNLPAIDVEAEWESLLANQKRLGDRLIRFHRLAGNPGEVPSLAELERRLRDRRTEYHGLHFVGHGDYSDTERTGYLLFETDRGRANSVPADVFGELLRDNVRFAVLNSCLGAETDQLDPFAGVAQALVRNGLAAVVGMQYEITSKAAVAFAEVFYEGLVLGSPVDAAVVDARATIRRNVNELEWATPVLYMGSRDGRLFRNLTQAGQDSAGPDSADVIPNGSAPASDVRRGKRDASQPADVAGFHGRFDVRAVVDSSPFVSQDERAVADLLLFATRNQQTWLVATDKQLFCVLDDAGTRGTSQLIKWRMTHRDAEPIVVRPYKLRTGKIDVGLRKSWLYSTALHPDPEALQSDIAAMLTGAVDDPADGEVYEWEEESPDGDPVPEGPKREVPDFRDESERARVTKVLTDFDPFSEEPDVISGLVYAAGFDTDEPQSLARLKVLVDVCHGLDLTVVVPEDVPDVRFDRLDVLVNLCAQAEFLIFDLSEPTFELALQLGYADDMGNSADDVLVVRLRIGGPWPIMRYFGLEFDDDADFGDVARVRLTRMIKRTRSA